MNSFKICMLEMIEVPVKSDAWSSEVEDYMEKKWEITNTEILENIPQCGRCNFWASVAVLLCPDNGLVELQIIL